MPSLAFLRHLPLAAAFFVLSPAALYAQVAGYMLDQCAAAAQTHFRDLEARTEMQDNGRRTDGTYAINGRIFLETRFEDFACSWDDSGVHMTEFFAQGAYQTSFAPEHRAKGPVSGGHGGQVLTVTGVASNDVLNVRSGPSTHHGIVGALSNGSAVRNLGCFRKDSSTWCRIQMMDDMRSQGWVNARYLTSGSAVHQPSRPTEPQTRTVRVRFAVGTSGAVYSGKLEPGGSLRYVLGARNRQTLVVRLNGYGSGLSYQILNPDRSFLLDQVPSGQDYRGELWQSGDHVIEVINRSGSAAEFSLSLEAY